jgi:hypothetical protein
MYHQPKREGWGGGYGIHTVDGEGVHVHMDWCSCTCMHYPPHHLIRLVWLQLARIDSMIYVPKVDCRSQCAVKSGSDKLHCSSASCTCWQLSWQVERPAAGCPGATTRFKLGAARHQ